MRRASLSSPFPCSCSCSADAAGSKITRYESEAFNAYVWVEGRDLAVVVDRTLVVPTKRTVVPDSDISLKSATS